MCTPRVFMLPNSTKLIFGSVIKFNHIFKDRISSAFLHHITS